MGSKQSQTSGSLQALLDRESITDAGVRYAQGVDQRNWPLYASAFSPDAVIELTILPGESFSVDGFREFLSGTYDALRLSGQHRLSNPLVEITGDSARAVTEFFATTLEETGPAGEPELLGAAGLYVDQLARYGESWLITHRLLVLKSTESRVVGVSPSLREAIVSTRDGALLAAVAWHGEDRRAMTPELLLDRARIHDVLVAYCHAQDQNLWQLWDGVFTPDATIELPGVTPDPLSPTGHRELLLEFNLGKLSSQHALSNTLYDIEGDVARTVTELTAISLHETGKPGVLRRTSWMGLYIDDLLRTQKGWRIRHRVIAQKNVQIDELEYSKEVLGMIRAGVGRGILEGWKVD